MLNTEQVITVVTQNYSIHTVNTLPRLLVKVKLVLSLSPRQFQYELLCTNGGLKVCTTPQRPLVPCVTALAKHPERSCLSLLRRIKS